MRVEAIVVGGGFVALAAATLLLAPVVGGAADPGGSGPSGKTPAATLETVPGAVGKRVTLTAKAAERLGIEIGKVGEEVVVRRQMVSGLIIPPSGKPITPKPAGGGFALPAPAPRPAAGFADFGRVPAAAAPAPQPVAIPAAAPQPVAAAPVPGEVWVLVSLTPGEWDRLAKDKPARLVPLATRDRLGKELVAQPSGIAPLEDMKRSMLSLHYVVPGKDHGLALNNRMRVELELAGSAEKEKVVPYSAVFYDAKGSAWVYVNTSPLAFERQRIAVDRVVGDRAVLSEGPPVGTPVVTVGAALLYGAEIFGK
jgi:hypothetical protein